MNGVVYSGPPPSVIAYAEKELGSHPPNKARDDKAQSSLPQRPAAFRKYLIGVLAVLLFLLAGAYFIFKKRSKG